VGLVAAAASGAVEARPNCNEDKNFDSRNVVPWLGLGRLAYERLLS
jgi:hypothetical protein